MLYRLHVQWSVIYAGIPADKTEINAAQRALQVGKKCPSVHFTDLNVFPGFIHLSSVQDWENDLAFLGRLVCQHPDHFDPRYASVNSSWASERKTREQIDMY